MAREHRRLLRDPRARARVSLSITPMIDVVFQLLIYFLLTAGFMGNERHLRAEMPPERSDRARSTELALEREPLVIRVSRDAARCAEAAEDLREEFTGCALSYKVVRGPWARGRGR